MHDPAAEGQRWLAQADNDLAFARYALDGGFFHQACFVAQQCAENFTRIQAERAIGSTETVLKTVRAELPQG